MLSPIGMVFQVIILLATIGNLSMNNGFYSTDALILILISSCLQIVSSGCITYGFAKKKRYAWYMVYVFLILNVSSNIISATQASTSASQVGQIIGSLIIPMLIGIYYYKRKPLFISNKTGIYDIKKTTINYCRKCGNRVTKHSVFCNKCGAKIDWN